MDGHCVTTHSTHRRSDGRDERRTPTGNSCPFDNDKRTHTHTHRVSAVTGAVKREEKTEKENGKWLLSREGRKLCVCGGS